MLLCSGIPNHFQIFKYPKTWKINQRTSESARPCVLAKLGNDAMSSSSIAARSRVDGYLNGFSGPLKRLLLSCGPFICSEAVFQNFQSVQDFSATSTLSPAFRFLLITKLCSSISNNFKIARISSQCRSNR